MASEETGKHLNHLDGWRGVAVFAVVFGHFWADAHIWDRLSSSGVDLFFVLSGRLMAEILFVRRAPLPTFFIRRISRIFPALIVFVLVTTAAFYGTIYSQGPVAVAVALTMTLNYAMIFSHPIGLMDHLWSLCVEEHAYIILALIAFCLRRRTRYVGILIALFGVAALINGIVRLDLLGEDLLATRWRTDVSLAGIFIAGALWLRFRSTNFAPWVSPLALAVALVFRLQPLALWNFGVGTVALAMAVVALDTSSRTIRRLLSLRPLRQLGLWSYSLYLWQQPFYKLFFHGHWSPLLMVPSACACALASFYIVERPAREFLNAMFTPDRVQRSADRG